MKKFLFFLLPALLCVFSCKKDNSPGNSMSADEIQLEDAVVISKGTLVFASATNETGLAKIYVQRNGRFVVALEDMEYQTIFDLAIYLSATPVYSQGKSLKLYSAKNFDNNIYYMLQPGVQVADYPYIVIQKPAAAEPIAVASLR